MTLKIGEQGTVTGLPSPGAAGQAMVTAGPGVLGWAAQAAGDPPIVPGYWYDNRLTASGSTTSQSLAAAGAHYVPVFVDQAVAIDQVAAQLNVAGTITMGVSEMVAGTRRPGALLGSAALTTTAGSNMRIFTLPATYTVGPGWFYIGLSPNVAGSMSGSVGSGGLYRKAPFPSATANINAAGLVTFYDPPTGSGALVSNPATGAFSTVIASATVFFHVAV